MKIFELINKIRINWIMFDKVIATKIGYSRQYVSKMRKIYETLTGVK